MTQRKKRGYKAPSNYEPYRGKKLRRFTRGEDSSHRGGADPRDENAGRNSASRDEQAGRKSAPRDERRPAGGSKRVQRGERSPESARSRAVRPAKPAEGREPRTTSSPPPHQRSARVFTFGADGEPGPQSSARGSDRTIPADASFAELGLGGNIVRTLGELGADRPFPIQSATIPDVLAGTDVLGRGRTGSGKTIAFAAPLVERMLHLKASGAFAADAAPQKTKAPLKRGERQRGTRARTRNPKALILAPTRELALQIDRTVQPIARSVGFYTAQLVGGVPIDPQIHALERGIDIVIGTPGRIQDLVQRRKLDLREVLITVVDEADHMCELGFLEPVQRIMRDTVRGGQRLLFSATLDRDVDAIVEEFLRNPVVHEVASEAPEDTRHRVFVVLREHKDDVLVQLAQHRRRTIVFTRTRAYAERVAGMLADAGVRSVALHGDLKQAVRERGLAKFSEGKADVLVATDVAARGIHVDDVELVVQADPPDEAKTYLHRAGRTGRAGNRGEVITVIPRTRQKRTREMLDEAGIEPEVFQDFVPGQQL